MKEYIIRNKIIPSVSSRVMQITGRDLSLEKAVEIYGIDFVLDKVLSENIKYAELIRAYHTTCPDPSIFSRMYEIIPGYGLILDAHITLCYFDIDFLAQQKKVFPWIYIDSQKYIGDTWWFEDQEIINDITQLSTIEFLKKYKGI